MKNVIATLEILKGMKSNKPVGRIEVTAPTAESPHYGIYYFIGPLHRGFTHVPVDCGRTLAIGRAKELAVPFAKQHGCKWVKGEWPEDDGMTCTEWLPVSN
jgi:hypothetical protein